MHFRQVVFNKKASMPNMSCDNCVTIFGLFLGSLCKDVIY